MSIKILLADDSITIQKVIGIIFGSGDYSLTVVDNGKAALEKAREVVPDVLLIDALMPGMTGYEVCEAIRSTPSLAAKPILLLTGSFEPFDEEKAKSCGADDFLAKPFESQQIVTKVKELYQQGSSRAAAQFQPPPEEQPFAAPAEFSAPPLENPFSAAPASAPAAETTPDDIWGAFTSTAEPAPATPPPAYTETAPVMEEVDVFALINEEPETEPVRPAAPQETPERTGSQWVPVEEQTFEFHEERVAEPPAAGYSEPAQALSEISFGEISFEEPLQPAASSPPAAEPPLAETPTFADAAPSFDEPPAPGFSAAMPAFAQAEPAPAFAPAEPVASAPPLAPSAATSVQLSEEQLKAAIATLSQDVIERIVWEVVPELAETMIKEAIRKIKEGL